MVLGLESSVPPASMPSAVLPQPPRFHQVRSSLPLMRNKIRKPSAPEIFRALSVSVYSVQRGDFEVLEFRRRVPGADTNQAAGHRRLKLRRLDRRGQRNVAAIFGKQFLDVITRQAEPTGAVKIEEVQGPCAMVQVPQQRRVARHTPLVGVALQAGHECGLERNSDE